MKEIEKANKNAVMINTIKLYSQLKIGEYYIDNGVMANMIKAELVKKFNPRKGSKSEVIVFYEHWIVNKYLFDPEDLKS